MIWIGFGYGGKKRMAFLNNRMDSKEYQNMLEMNLVPLTKEFENEECIYQQDNASIHVSNSTKNWLLSKNISCLDWPALSPDLNPAENVFAIISRRLYENGKQYNSLIELKKAIQKVWDELPNNTLNNLVTGMGKRIFELTLNQGKKIDK